MHPNKTYRKRAFKDRTSQLPRMGSGSRRHLTNLPPSGGYDHIITAIDVFSRYLFAYPVTRINATAVANVIMDILCKHTYLPTTIITDLGTQFNAQVTHEIFAVLGIEVKHATMKHAQR